MPDDAKSPFPAADPFTAFWGEFMTRMTSMGFQPPQPGADAMQQMRRAFFDAMAQYADNFMRSEAFLGAMKQSMDSALAWQQSMNQFLQKGLSTAQMPSRADTDHIVQLMRGLEDRLLGRVAILETRMDSIEKRLGK
ncbi:MAG: hypothetical protein CHACPFDD_03190 [Phycisphaerae bacterium]|nr:hypothetical protein [Phycisphaerae bacterium]